MAGIFSDSVRLEMKLYVALCHRYRKDVLASHGNHIDVRTRNAAAAIFWLPDLLYRDEEIPLPDDMPFPWLQALSLVKDYASRVLPMFRWDLTDDTMGGREVPGIADQYVALLRAWRQLVRVPINGTNFDLSQAWIRNSGLE